MIFVSKFNFFFDQNLDFVLGFELAGFDSDGEDGTEFDIPSAVAWDEVDSNRLLVGTSSGCVCAFDVEASQLVVEFQDFDCAAALQKAQLTDVRFSI